jgi:hypothetical protein
MTDTITQPENVVESPVIDKVEAPSKHPHQGDLDTAQKALDVGSTLSGVSIMLHIALVIVFTALNSQPINIGAIILFGGVYLGILASWAIIHSLLSIVVTNALTAKYMIFLSAKK